MALGSVVLAYCLLTTQGNGGPSCDAPNPGGNQLHWNALHPPYKFNASGSADLGAEVYPALDSGFQSWNDVTGVGYAYAGCTLKGKGSVIDGSGDATADGDSIVTWIESGWPYPAATIAITWTYFFEDGEIGEADMLMNGDDYFWTTASAGGSTDVQSIATHEAGHYLGLGHTTDPSATMFATVDEGETQKRSLAPDDIAGATHIYGSSASSGATFDGECVGGGGSGNGCGCTLEGTAAPRPGLLAGVVSVLALAAFGMRRHRGASTRFARSARTGDRFARSARTGGGTVAVLALALFGVRTASATVMIDQSLEALAADSTAVVHADVTSVETKTDGQIIWTTQTLRVRDVLSGSLAGAKTFELVTPGGTLPAGVRGPRGYAGVTATGIPRFTAGEEVIVFVQPTHGDEPYLTVTAFQQGKFDVRRDAKGRATIDRDLSGVERMVRTEDGLSPVLGDEFTGLAYDELAARIRALPTHAAP